MAKKKRKVPGLNGSSTADIAFILLIFFLTTTSMNVDSGLERRLPPPPDPNQKEDDVKVKARNVLVVAVNMYNEISYYHGDAANGGRVFETGVQPNNFDKWSNYVHMFGAGYFVDTGENAVVFVIGDGVPPTAEFSVEYKNIVKAGTFDISTLLTYTPDDATVTYESANEDTATVDEDGVVTAVEVGATTVTATVTNADGTTATATIIINVTSE